MSRLTRTLLLAGTAASIMLPATSASAYTDAELAALYAG